MSNLKKYLEEVKSQGKFDFPYHVNPDCRGSDDRERCPHLEEMREEDNRKWGCSAPKDIQDKCPIRKTYKR